VAHYSTHSVLVQSKRGSGVNVTEEQLFEHERFMPLAGWSSRHLLPTERNRYSRQEDGMHSTNTFPQRIKHRSKLKVAFAQQEKSKSESTSRGKGEGQTLAVFFELVSKLLCCA